MGEQGFIRENIVPRFTAESGIDVEFSFYTDDAMDTLAERDSFKGADLVILYGNRLGSLSRSIDFLKLRDYPELYKDRTFFQNEELGGLNSCWQNFLPINSDVYLFIASKKADEYRSFPVESGILGWQDAADWMLKASREEGRGLLALTGVPGKNLIYFIGGIIIASGGEFPDLNSPGARQALGLIESLRPAIHPEIGNFDSVADPLLSGDAWFAFAHCARIGSVLLEKPEEFDVFMAPVGDAGSGSVAGVNGIGIPSSGIHSKEALRFVEFLTRPEIQVDISRGTGGFIPTVHEALDALGSSPLDRVIRYGIRILSIGRIRTIPVNYGDWRNIKQVYENLFMHFMRSGQINQDDIETAALHLRNFENGTENE